MPQPRKYSNNAERQAAYRKRSAAAQALSLDELFSGLRELRVEIDRRRKLAKARRFETNNPAAIRSLELVELMNHIETELDRLMARP
jgi:23S rRNA maturation mini-RNase III